MFQFEREGEFAVSDFLMPGAQNAWTKPARQCKAKFFPRPRNIPKDILCAKDKLYALHQRDEAHANAAADMFNAPS